MHCADMQNIESDDEKSFIKEKDNFIPDYLEFADQCLSSAITKEINVSRKEEDHFELIDGIEDDDRRNHVPIFIGYEYFAGENENDTIVNISNENWGENPFILDGNEEHYQEHELVVDFIRAIERW